MLRVEFTKVGSAAIMDEEYPLVELTRGAAKEIRAVADHPATTPEVLDAFLAGISIGVQAGAEQEFTKVSWSSALPAYCGGVGQAAHWLEANNPDHDEVSKILGRPLSASEVRALHPAGALGCRNSEDGKSSELLDTRARAREIYDAAFTVLRNTSPTLDPTLYGKAYEIYGSEDPKKWNPAEVEALCNLNGIIACGLENYAEIIIYNHKAGLEHELAWLVDRLERIALPDSVLNRGSWQRFCDLVAGRPLGRPLIHIVEEEGVQSIKTTSNQRDVGDRKVVSISYSDARVWEVLATILAATGVLGGIWFLLGKLGVF